MGILVEAKAQWQEKIEILVFDLVLKVGGVNFSITKLRKEQ